MSTDFDEEDRSSIIYPKAFYTWKSEIRYTVWWYIGLLLREYLKYLNYSSGIFIIIYSVDRLANKNLHHVYFVKKNLGLQNLSLSTATYKFWQQHFYQGKY